MEGWKLEGWKLEGWKVQEVLSYPLFPDTSTGPSDDDDEDVDARRKSEQTAWGAAHPVRSKS